MTKVFPKKIPEKILVTNIAKKTDKAGNKCQGNSANFVINQKILHQKNHTKYA